MEWAESEDLTNDRCSTASSTSNSGDVNGSITTQANGPKSMNSQNLNGNQNTQANSNTSLNLDSMSDGELSDFSLNDSDEEEFRSTTNTGNNAKYYQSVLSTCICKFGLFIWNGMN